MRVQVQELKDLQDKLETKVDKLTTKLKGIAEVKGTHKKGQQGSEGGAL